ncbi:MAG: 6-phosphofructokinase [Planctomycetota bacterium]
MTTPLSSPPKPKTDIRRVGILFSGGPAPAANAVIGSAAVCFSRAGIEVLGFLNGYTHLMAYEPGRGLEEGAAYVMLHAKDLEGRRTGPGIMIGTARANPGKSVAGPDDLKDPEATAELRTVYEALCSLEIDALVSIGGDDTLTTAAKFKLFQDGLPADKRRIRVVHLPKTIDNDYEGIDFTFGYFTAVDMLATEVRNLLADAEAANAWYVVQVMGRKAGWLAYGAAIAGESSLVIGLEDILDAWRSEEVTVHPKTGEEVLGDDGKPLMRKIINLEAVVDRIVQTVLARLDEGKPYGVILIAEGLGEYLSLVETEKCVSRDEFLNLKPDSFGHFPVSQLKFTGRVGRWVAEKVKKLRDRDLKISGLQFGYEVRAQRPTAFDVALGSQLGVGAYRALAEEGLDGVMVSVRDQLELDYKPFFNPKDPKKSLVDRKTLRAKTRLIKPGEGFHQLARYLEIRVDEERGQGTGNRGEGTGGRNDD